MKMEYPISSTEHPMSKLNALRVRPRARASHLLPFTSHLLPFTFYLLPITYHLLLLTCSLPPLAALAQGLPQWYIDKGWPTEDTVGDGIPDEWKRRTFAPRDADGNFLPSAHLDRDNDGLTDLEEFWYGSDPRTASTMGDFWLDSEKRAHGLGAWGKVTSTVSFAQWQAWSGLDEAAWRRATRPSADGLTGAFAGFALSTQPYAAEAGTVDFWLEYRADRHTLLTLSDALATNTFPLAKGEGRARLRVAYGGPAALTMDPAPGTLADTPGATNGLWLCEMKVKPFRPNTVVFNDGDTPPPPQGGFDSVDAIIITAAPTNAVHSLEPPEPTRDGPPTRWPTVTLLPGYVSQGVTMLSDGWYCVSGDACGDCAWPTNGMIEAAAGMPASTLGATLPVISKQAAWNLLTTPELKYEVTVTQKVFSAGYPSLFGSFAFRVRPCGALHHGPEVRGAEHILNPTHEPGHFPTTTCGAAGCLCSGASLTHVGFDHAKVNTRNLNHPDESAEDKKHLHCLGIIYSGNTTNLLDFTESFGLDITNRVKWEVNGKTQTGHTLKIGSEPKDLDPKIFRIKLLEKESGDVWDRFILVVNNRKTKSEFDGWYDGNKTNTAWLAELPAAYVALSNRVGSTSFYNPEPSTTNLWCAPDEPGQYMHHAAKWQMRSEKTPGNHGHQTCYDDAGKIILNGVSAGTADFSSPRWHTFRPHVREDVDPFVRALQLDGNPCTRSWDALTHALIHDGENLVKYRECRPAVPNDKPMLNPGELP